MKWSARIAVTATAAAAGNQRSASSAKNGFHKHAAAEILCSDVASNLNWGLTFLPLPFTFPLNFSSLSFSFTISPLLTHFFNLFPFPLLSLLLEVGPIKSSPCTRNRIGCILTLKYEICWQRFYYFPKNQLTKLAHLVQLKRMLMSCLKDWGWRLGPLPPPLNYAT